MYSFWQQIYTEHTVDRTCWKNMVTYKKNTIVKQYNGTVKTIKLIGKKQSPNIRHWHLAYANQKQEVKVIWQKAPHGGPFPG